MLSNLAEVRARIFAGLNQSAQWLASQALGLGQNTLGFVLDTMVMLYLLFSLCCGTAKPSARIRAAVPLPSAQRRRLVDGFVVVIRATVKGSLVVALVQGALGGLMFWFLGLHAPVLWGVVMALMSLIPAIGAPVVWLPFAVYLFAIGATWQSVLLAVCGALVIGSADNILRPILVGRDTRIPDYLVLLATLGGIAAMVSTASSLDL